MMPGSEERWREGTATTPAGALDNLLERMTNDFTPQHDSQHYQPGFVPAASPPWTTSGQTPLSNLGSQMPPLQSTHSNLGSQMPSLQSNHNLGSQVSSMQSSHSNIAPPMQPIQPVTTSATGNLSLNAQLGGSAARSYSVSQDLFTELGGRSPLLRSSSDLGLRLSHYQAQGNNFNEDRLDGLMDSSMDSLDGMLGNHDSAFFPEVQQRRSDIVSGTPPPPPHQSESQSIPLSSVPHSEFSFYSSENDRLIDGVSVNNITAKFSNFTASLGSWFGPFDPFRSNLTAAQTKTPVSQASAVTTTLESSLTNDVLRSPQCNNSVRNVQATSQPVKASRPSYSDVLSKNTVQENRLNTATVNVNSRSSSSNSNSSSSNVISPPPQSPSPAPSTSRPELQNRNQPGCNGKAKSRNSNSTSSNSTCGGVANNNHINRVSSSKVDGHATSSRVGLDDFDLSEIGLSNGCISAYEHYDWGEGPQLFTTGNEQASGYKASGVSPSHQTKKNNSKGDGKKNTPEKSNANLDGDSVRSGSDQLNNRVSSSQPKQQPRRTSYINNNLNSASTASSTLPATNSGSSTSLHNTNVSHSAFIPTTSNASHAVNNNNNNDCNRSDGPKSKNSHSTKEERKTFVEDPPSNSNTSSSRPGRKGAGNSRSDRSERTREAPKRGAPKRKKDASFTHSELVVLGWSVAVQWLGFAVQAVLWLGTLSMDVVVMSSRLCLHLLTLLWARMFEYWIIIKTTAYYYWIKWTTALKKKMEKEDKKLPGRDKKLHRGLEYNISLPTTGEEAMKRLMACKGKDPYSILGVTQECTDEDIKKYYKRQAFLVHPDKNKIPGAEEAFKILAHAFEIIGEPERRREYDARLAEEVQLEGAWGELASLLTRLQEKLDEAANTIRCTNCNKRHRRTKLPRPIYAARHCAECQIRHAAREGDIWAESTFLGLRWRYYACMEGAVYDISDWASCQSEHLKHLQANTHSVQYRIVSGKKNPPSKNTTPEFPSDPDLEEFFNNLCKEKFGKNYASGSSTSGSQQMPDMRKRKGKKKK